MTLLLHCVAQVLQNQLDSSHASKLEWIIIWLIVIEGVLEVFEIMMRRMGWYDV